MDLGAFALARFRFAGANALSFYLLVGTSMPALLFMVPLYFMWARLGLVNNLVGLIIIYAALYSPFATYLLRSFLVSIPMDFEEAARIDGANDIQVLTRIISAAGMAWVSDRRACCGSGCLERIPFRNHVSSGCGLEADLYECAFLPDPVFAGSGV